MAYTPTSNYGLAMPNLGDPADIEVINQFMTEKVDELLYENRQISAPPFSTETAYTAGEMCVYENVLYKFTADKAAGNWDSTKVTATNLADEVTDAAQSGGTEVEANPVEAATADLHKLKVDTTVYGIPDPTVTKTATGNPIEFSDGADAPLVKCTTTIQGYQEGTGTPSPDNVRPIHAYTQSTISVGGSVNLVLGVISECNIGPTGALQYNSEFDMYYARVRRGVTYSANITVTGGFFTTYPEIGSVSYNSERVVNLQSPFVSPIDGFICFRTSAGVTNGMLVEGETMPSYVAPNITEHTANFSSSIYQGNADFVGGSVVCDWIKRVLSSTDNFNRFGGDSQTTTFKFSNFDIADTAVGEISNILVYNPNAWDPSRHLDYTFIVGNNELFVSVPTSVASNNSEFSTWLSNNTVEIAYKKITPTTSSVTPTNLPIKSLSGYSHIESTTGDMEVEYITQTYQPIVDLIDEAADTKHTYSTTEHVVGKWIDGSPLYEKTYTQQLSGYTADIDISNLSASQAWVYDGFFVTSQTNLPLNSAVVNGIYAHVNIGATPPVIALSCMLESDATAYVTIRYTKTSSNNRSLSKGATDSLRADLSKENEEIEELLTTDEKTVKKAQSEGEESVDKVDKVDKVDEPTETIEEKEENER